MQFHRQEDILSPKKDLRFAVTIVGVGGIGSPTALALCKMGCSEMTIIDDDLLEGHNMPNQIYPLEHVGKPKVESLAEVLRMFTGVNPSTLHEKATAKTKLSGVVVSGVDSMCARKEIWPAIRFNPAVELYIDGRMGGETARIYVVRPTNVEDVKRYEGTLHSSEEAVPVACTGRAIIYNTLMIASLIANVVKRYGRGEEWASEYTFDFPTAMFMTSAQ